MSKSFPASAVYLTGVVVLFAVLLLLAWLNHHHRVAAANAARDDADWQRAAEKYNDSDLPPAERERVFTP